jgi:urease accessory protein
MSVQSIRLSAAGAALTLLAGPATAHTGSAPVVGFVSGFLHPISGLDHVLAMVAVGVLATLIGGRALWLVPASFLGAMAVGSALGFSLPFVELAIVASVIVLGAVVALAPRMSVAMAMALAAAFAVFHGHAHGAEMPAAVSALSYGLGFLLGTALLHAAGIGLGLATAQGAGRAALRVGGGAVAVLGLALLVV